jgi:acyl-CoA thioesterase-1
VQVLLNLPERLFWVGALLWVGAFFGGCTKQADVPQEEVIPAVSYSLPKVLIVGDSISKGYYPYVRSNLVNVAETHRPEGNHGATWDGLMRLDAWLEGRNWDVIHFNFGLHDIHRTTLEQYEANLTRIVERLKKTKARLIFATSTPVLEGTPTFLKGSATRYNEVARRVMERAGGIALDDLHGFASAHPEYQRPKDLHFTDQGYAALGKEVADSIIRALGEMEARSAEAPSRSSP